MQNHNAQYLRRQLPTACERVTRLSANTSSGTGTGNPTVRQYIYSTDDYPGGPISGSGGAINPGGGHIEHGRWMELRTYELPPAPETAFRRRLIRDAAA